MIIKFKPKELLYRNKTKTKTKFLIFPLFHANTFYWLTKVEITYVVVPVNGFCDDLYYKIYRVKKVY
jgi:hypothetical protein